LAHAGGKDRSIGTNAPPAIITASWASTIIHPCEAGRAR
jgi:hypothetical protein